MSAIGLFYSRNSNDTSKAAQMILSYLEGKVQVDEIDVDTVQFETFTIYDKMIFGVSTWFDGELPNYWDELLPGLEQIDFTGKKIAIFGPGNMKDYPENFLDGIGILADFFSERGAEIIGYTSTDGFVFESSKALKNGQFCGLGLDFRNREKYIGNEIHLWCEQILKS